MKIVSVLALMSAVACADDVASPDEYRAEIACDVEAADYLKLPADRIGEPRCQAPCADFNGLTGFAHDGCAMTDAYFTDLLWPAGVPSGCASDSAVEWEGVKGCCYPNRYMAGFPDESGVMRFGACVEQ